MKNTANWRIVWVGTCGGHFLTRMADLRRLQRLAAYPWHFAASQRAVCPHPGHVSGLDDADSLAAPQTMGADCRDDSH